MKIASAHRLAGDEIIFVKGSDRNLREQEWDQIYVTSLFTFAWRSTVETIRFYNRGRSPILVGGVLASLLPEEIKAETGVVPWIGPYRGDPPELCRLSEPNKTLGPLLPEIATRGVDALPPDYGIFATDSLPYSQMLKEAYITRSTKGCGRHCSFCAVSTLETELIDYCALTPVVEYVAKNWGERRHLMLLDDNFLQSKQFDRIIDQIRDLGFHRGAKLNRAERRVDFNQGLDVRLLTRTRLQKLFSIALRPLRIAFDNVSLAALYEKTINCAIDLGFSEISSYVLYNYLDRTSDLYNRLRIAAELNDKYGTRVYSFPMKFLPCDRKDRKHLGPHWSRRQVRGVQCILNASHGIAPARSDFFWRAFGSTCEEFERIILMPENYIINRAECANDGRIEAWERLFREMAPEQRAEAISLIAAGKGTRPRDHPNGKSSEFLKHYQHEQTETEGTCGKSTSST